MQIVGYILVCRSYSFVCTLHHLIIIIVQTYLKTLNIKCLSDIFCLVWVRLSIFSQLSIIYDIRGCVFSVYPFPLWWLREYMYTVYTLSCYHHQIGCMSYYPLFRVRSWNNGMHCMSLYILIVWSQQFIVVCNPMCHHGTSSSLVQVMACQEFKSLWLSNAKWHHKT